MHNICKGDDAYMGRGILDYISEIFQSIGSGDGRKVSGKLFSRKDLDELMSELDEFESKFRKFLKKVK